MFCAYIASFLTRCKNNSNIELLIDALVQDLAKAENQTYFESKDVSRSFIWLFGKLPGPAQ